MAAAIIQLQLDDEDLADLEVFIASHEVRPSRTAAAMHCFRRGVATAVRKARKNVEEPAA